MISKPSLSIKRLNKGKFKNARYYWEYISHFQINHTERLLKGSKLREVSIEFFPFLKLGSIHIKIQFKAKLEAWSRKVIMIILPDENYPRGTMIMVIYDVKCLLQVWICIDHLRINDQVVCLLWKHGKSPVNYG